jgi:hypothetical protein
MFIFNFLKIFNFPNTFIIFMKRKYSISILRFAKNSLLLNVAYQYLNRTQEMYFKEFPV